MINKRRVGINHWMVILMFLTGFLNLLFSEKIELFNGHNWDGVSYVAWAKDFFHEAFEKGLSDYSVQRIFLSFIIHYGLRTLGIPLQETNIIFAYGVWNLGLLVLSAYVWGLISDCLNLTNRGKWLGFCGLFINYPILKMNFYYPVLTDTTAFTLGMLSFYFYLTRRSKALLATSLIGAFTWPTIFFFGLLLFLFSNWKGQKENVSSKASKRGWPMALLMTLLVFGFVLKVIVKTHYFTQLTKVHVYQPPNLSVLNLSIVLLLSYIFFVYHYLFNATPIGWREIWSQMSVKRLLATIACFAVVQWLIHTLAVEEHLVTPIRHLYRNHTVAISNPLIWGVAHVVYYGPILILTAFLWKPICRAIQPYGIGLVLMVTGALFFSIDSESRHWINFLPIFIAFTCKVTDTLSWKTSYYWLIGIGAFLYSKVWFDINPLGPGSDHGNVLLFPYQKYYLSHGPFMSDMSYIAQGSIVLWTALLFYFVLFKYPSTATSPPSDKI